MIINVNSNADKKIRTMITVIYIFAIVKNPLVSCNT